MSSATLDREILEEAFWFGPAEGKLFGELTRPATGDARGGVLLAPPIGREAYAARYALRRLAQSLAKHGFVTLRIDYPGTGDAGGKFEDPGRDRAWVASVAEATSFLESFGLTSIAAIGMRLGATILGVAAVEHELNFSSLVLWDPCDSGRTYLRELSALEALRREDYQASSDGSVETSEFVFSPQAVNDLGRLSLSKLPSGSLADRVLVLTREDRPLSNRLRARLNEEHVEWATTSEQGALLEVEGYYSVMPTRSMEDIEQWLCASPSPLEPFTITDVETVIDLGDGSAPAVKERVLQIGPRRVFAIVTEPLSAPVGPLIVLLISINDDHVGRARLWVEMSRHWASLGIRSVRFDFSGFGSSSLYAPGQRRPIFDTTWFDDVDDVVHTLSSDDLTNTYFVGLCSGAFVAVEGALSIGARGVCAINPPVAIDYLHRVSRMERSERAFLRSLGTLLKKVPASHKWVAATIARLNQAFPLVPVFPDVLSKLVSRGTDVLVLASAEDRSPRPDLPFIRSIDIRKLGKRKKYEVTEVDGLDHGIHNAEGRSRAIQILNRVIVEDFLGEESRSPRTHNSPATAP